MGSPSRKAALWWVGVVLLAALPSLLCSRLNHDAALFGMYYDDTAYYVSAKSFARDGSFRMLHLPGEPASTKYPPLWPAWLSLAWRINPDFPANLEIASWLGWLPAPFFLAGVLWWLRRQGFSDIESAALTVFVGLSPVFLILASSLMSEVFLCMLLFIIFGLLGGSPSPKRAALAGAVGGLAFLARSSAIPLLATVPLTLLWQRKPKQAATFIATMFPVVAAWFAWSSRHRLNDFGDPNLAFYSGYAAEIKANVDASNLWHILQENLTHIPLETGRLLSFYAGSDLMPTYLCTLIGVGGLIGAAKLGLSQPTAYLAGLLGMLILWCYPPNERFVFPALPVVAAGFYSLLKDMISTFWRGLRNRSLVERAIAVWGLSVAGLVLGWGAAQNLILYRDYPLLVEHARLEKQKKAVGYQWIRSQPPGFWIAAQDAELYLHTGHKAISLHIPMKLHYGRDRREVMEWYASLPAPRGFPTPERLFWTPDHFDLAPDEAAEVQQRIRSRVPPPLFDQGDVVVLPLQQASAKRH
jgi:hypothetical protein